MQMRKNLGWQGWEGHTDGAHLICLPEVTNKKLYKVITCCCYWWANPTNKFVKFSSLAKSIWPSSRTVAKPTVGSLSADPHSPLTALGPHPNGWALPGHLWRAWWRESHRSWVWAPETQWYSGTGKPQGAQGDWETLWLRLLLNDSLLWYVAWWIYWYRLESWWVVVLWKEWCEECWCSNVALALHWEQIKNSKQLTTLYLSQSQVLGHSEGISRLPIANAGWLV